MSLLNDLTEDLYAGAKRIVNNPELLDGLTKSQLAQLSERLATYNPTTDAGRINRNRARNAITKKLTISKEAAINPNSLVEPARKVELISSGSQTLNKTIVLFIRIKGKGFTKAVNSGDFLHRNGRASGVNPNWVHVSIDTIDKAEMMALNSHTGQFKSWLKNIAIETDLLGPGMYLIPTALMETVDNHLIDFVNRRESLLDHFEARYQMIIEDAERELGDEFDKNMYQDFKEIRSSFKVEARYLSLNLPAALQTLNKEIYDKEQEKISIELGAAADDIRAALRASFAGLVTNFTDKLGRDEETGKMKVFNAARVTDLKEFLSTFEARNLTGDKELSKLAEQARKIITGVDPSKVGSDTELRKTLEDSFASIKEQASKLVVTKGRRFDLEDE